MTPQVGAGGSCALWPPQTQLDWHVSCAGAAESERTPHSSVPAARSSAQHGGFSHCWSGSHIEASRSLLRQAVLCLYVCTAYCYGHACWHQRLLRVVPFFVTSQATATSAQPSLHFECPFAGSRLTIQNISNHEAIASCAQGWI